ncbi:MAG: protein kinase [Acidobacteria bacterium]|nr:protein kinase [Acidobacteriota bacterium]
MKICRECSRCYEDAEASCPEHGQGALKPDRAGSCVVAGKYRLERLIGTGAMGTVYKGTHVGSGKVRAIKLLTSDYTSKVPAALERLRNEFQTGDLVGHRNIVRVYDYIELASGEACIVMEFIEGVSLRDYMGRPGKLQLPVDEAVSIAFQAAQGIDALHKKGILHRDLKPENIMLTRDEQGRLLVKVVDFGLAKSFKSLERERAYTDIPVREFAGTMLYTSPENCRGEELDERSDVYSLGIILYEMLAGRPPFTGKSSEVEQKHLSELPTPVEKLRPGTPPALAERVKQALDKNPQERPQSAGDFAHILNHILKNIPRSVEGDRPGPSLLAGAGARAVKAAPEAAEVEPASKPDGETPAHAGPAAAVDKTEKKANDQRRQRRAEKRQPEPQPDSYINIANMSSPTSKNSRAPRVINRHKLTSSRRPDVRRSAAVLLVVIVLCLATVGACYVYPNYKLRRFQEHLKQGQSRLDSGMHDEAIAEFTEAIGIDPAQPMPYYYRAVALHKKGDYEQAVKDYSEVLRLTPEYASAYQNRAAIFVQRGEYDRAIEDYSALLRFAADTNTYKLRGDAHFKNKNYSPAIADYTESLRLDPANAGALIGRTNAYTNRGGKGDEALAKADRARLDQLRKKNL